MPASRDRSRRTERWATAATMLALASVATPAAADCRLALALGFDVSRSVDERDYAIQTQGILAALAAPEIVRALLAQDRHVRLAAYEWSGMGDQRLVADWTTIRGQADIDRFAATIAGHVRHTDKLPTALGEALEFGIRLLGQAGDCTARTLDISGDGRNNAGEEPAEVKARTDLGGILVNGLAIGQHEGDIADYYHKVLIHGPGAFVEYARTHRDFPRVFRRKLERELTEPLMGGAPADPDAG